MKFKIKEIHIPLIETNTVEGQIDYADGEPEIQIWGYKNKDEIKLIETSEITIRLSGLPQKLQNLWQHFKVEVEDWVEKQEK